MNAFQFRPTVTDLEDRLTPISPGDVFNAVAQTGFGYAVILSVGGNPGALSLPAFQSSYQTLLANTIQQADTSVAVFRQFVTDLQAQAAAHPEQADFLAPYVQKYAGAESLAVMVGAYARSEATTLQNKITQAAASSGTGTTGATTNTSGINVPGLTNTNGAVTTAPGSSTTGTTSGTTTPTTGSGTTSTGGTATTGTTTGTTGSTSNTGIGTGTGTGTTTGATSSGTTGTTNPSGGTALPTTIT